MKIIKSLLIIALTLISLQSYAQNSEIHHRARIFYTGDSGLQQLDNLGIEMDHGKHKKGVFIESDYSERELDLVKSHGFDIEILINDVQSYYINRNKNPNTEANETRNFDCSSSGVTNYTTPDNFELGDMGGFFTYEEILANLDAMTEQYPNLITSRAPIGEFETFEGRPLYWLRMSDNPTMDEDEPEMLYDAVHHAREPASVSTLIFYMWYLLENYDTNDEIKGILDNTELYFVPVVNPDGYIYNHTIAPNGGGMWRKNRRDHGNGTYGVDNNRNYSIEWGTTGVSSDTQSDVYNGTEAFSEAENQAMKYFCEAHEFKMAFNNHSYSNLLLYPFGYGTNQPTPDHAIYQAISQEMVSQNGFANILAAELYPASGDSDDWMYISTAEKGKIFAFTPEIGSSSQGFWPGQSQIIPLCNSTMYMNLTAAHMITHYARIEAQNMEFADALTGAVTFDLQRMGLQDGDFSVTLSAVSDNITFSATPISVTGLDFLDVAEGLQMTFNVIPDIADGDIIEYQIIIDNGNYSQITPVYSFVYGESTESLTEDANEINNWNGNWGTTTADFVTSPTSITDSPFGNYGDNEFQTLELNETIDLTNVIAASLDFHAKWDIESDYDYVQVEVKTIGGSSWTPQCGQFTNPGTDDQEEGEPLYDNVQNSWVLESINLSDYIGEEIKIRFKLVSDGNVTGDGFYFDDLSVNVITGVVGIVSYPLDQNVLTQSYPNPASDISTINYELPNHYSHTELLITNDIGQRMAILPITNNKGSIELNVSTYESGIYFYQLIADGVVIATRKLVVID